jgi:glycerol-3-phosphate dehydrogenase (NAD(P)+)
MPERITILGDGAMGTVCSMILAGNGHQVRLWGAFPQAIDHLRQARENPQLLPGAKIPDNVELTSDDASCFEGSNLIISAIPTQYVRSVWQRLVSRYTSGTEIISCSKGIETSTLLRPTQILDQVIATAGKSAPLCALSGPNIAGEIARQLPATAVAASTDSALAQRAQAAYSNRYFRVYTNDDPIGVEISGAVKNVIALAAGMTDGLGLGCNAKAALLARGLVEITRLGLALGASPATFAGLAGLGDLVTTCISPEGRNRRTGEALGRGQTLQQILAASPSVVEGVPTTQAVMQLARNLDVEMPITEAVHSILFENVRPAAALQTLMSRQTRPESLS